MDSEHTLQLIPDYVLGLLPADDRRRVESHSRQCAACRMAMQRERAVESLVRGTVHAAAHPATGRLLTLRPPLPAARPRPAPFYSRLAPLSLAALMLVMGMLFASGRAPFSSALFGPAGSPTMTATHTQTPTATLAAAGDSPTATQAPEFSKPNSPAPQLTAAADGAPAAAKPPPAATPIIVAAAP